MKERGKFLVSTESAGTKEKTKAVISAVLFFIFGIVFATEDFADFIGNRGISILMTAAAFVYALVVLYLTFTRMQSYCAVYENIVVGKTAATLRIRPEEFELTYEQIKSVSTASERKVQSIILTANGRTYEVLALECCTQAVNEIKARIQ